VGLIVRCRRCDSLSCHSYVVDFKNTVIILTSNLGGDILANLPDGVDSSSPQVREQVMEHVRAHFPPEFINRLDDVVMFNRLSRDSMGDIVDVQIADGACVRVWCMAGTACRVCVSGAVFPLACCLLPVAYRVRS